MLDQVRNVRNKRQSEYDEEHRAIDPTLPACELGSLGTLLVISASFLPFSPAHPYRLTGGDIVSRMAQARALTSPFTKSLSRIVVTEGSTLVTSVHPRSGARRFQSHWPSRLGQMLRRPNTGVAQASDHLQAQRRLGVRSRSVRVGRASPPATIH